MADLRAKASAENEVEMARLSQQRATLTKEKADLLQARAELDLIVQDRVLQERSKVEATAKEQVRLELKGDMQAKAVEIAALKKSRDDATAARLAAEAARIEADARLSEMEVEILKQVEARAKAIRTEEAAKAEGEAKLKLAEKDKTIADMQAKLEEAQRKAAQGSQQLQGEVLELDLEQRLQSAFPWDEIMPVKHGARGGDVLQRVSAQPGVVSGVVYWEAKRAANWSPEWIVKAKQDARAAGAEAIVIVTTALPKGESTLCLVDGVVVCPVGLEVPVAHMLRSGLVEAANARKASEGRGTKEALIYSYLTGPQFKAWLSGIAEPFVQMQKDLESEVNATTTRWKKRRKQIERVRDSVAGMFGDLQGIVGAEMPELPGFVEEAEEEVEE